MCKSGYRVTSQTLSNIRRPPSPNSLLSCAESYIAFFPFLITLLGIVDDGFGVD
ncbi:hypothetical protein RIR_e50119_A0A2I1FDL2_9GLOM [Rhizophagus irregularis DAOM 181602=DAOM 197198]|nr:hypothetical protein RIR_e50119_A0A2I1FDL2_9GLOM [Rhizophagus irregularis DAOM 181602=DAOM 197198]